MEFTLVELLVAEIFVGEVFVGEVRVYYMRANTTLLAARGPVQLLMQIGRFVHPLYLKKLHSGGYVLFVINMS